MSWKSEVQVGRDPWCSNALRLVTPFVVKKRTKGEYKPSSVSACREQA
jgi:hypothetical protein